MQKHSSCRLLGKDLAHVEDVKRMRRNNTESINSMCMHEVKLEMIRLLVLFVQANTRGIIGRCKMLINTKPAKEILN